MQRTRILKKFQDKYKLGSTLPKFGDRIRNGAFSVIWLLDLTLLMYLKKYTISKEQSLLKKINRGKPSTNSKYLLPTELYPSQIDVLCIRSAFHTRNKSMKKLLQINIIFVFSALHQTDIITPNLFLFTSCPSCNASLVVSGNLSFAVSGNLKAKRQSHQHLEF